MAIGPTIRPLGMRRACSSFVKRERDLEGAGMHLLCATWKRRASWCISRRISVMSCRRDVAGNVTGDVTGDVTENVTGDVTGSDTVQGMGCGGSVGWAEWIGLKLKLGGGWRARAGRAFVDVGGMIWAEAGWCGVGWGGGALVRRR
jgi:hypothetical protein